MTDLRTLQRTDASQGSRQQGIVLGGYPIDIEGYIASVNTIKPTYAVSGATATQATLAAAGDNFVGIVDVDLSGYTAVKTMGGTYTTGDPLPIKSGRIRCLASLTSAAGTALTVGTPLELAGGGLLKVHAQSTNSTVRVPVAKLLEMYATTNAIVSVQVELL